MKLFIWNDPYGVSYGGSCLYVVAETEEQARDIARSAKTSEYGSGADNHNHLPEELGPPTRVLDAPCAEVYEWSE